MLQRSCCNSRRAVLGADAIEPDLISTRDGVLIARHYPYLATNTDVASRPEFASRKRENRPVDGELQSGRFRIVTLQEVIDLAKVESKRLGRPIAIYPETKNPTDHRPLAHARIPCAA